MSLTPRGAEPPDASPARGDHAGAPTTTPPPTPPVAAELARHYSHFRVSERLLLTGHSHQAWPDVGLEAQQRAWLDAAEFVDRKWGERAYPVAERVRAGWRRLLGDPAAEIALGQNTHELVVRFLSALPLRSRSRLVTTDAEFHTLRRQLDRLAEEGVELVKVSGRPARTVALRVAEAVNERTAAVLMSSVQFGTAEIVPDLAAVADACKKHGAELLVDAYHHLNVVPFDVGALGLSSAFVTGGGYKYCQLGEGNCFLRVPPGRDDLRPVVTGWFAEFAELEEGTRAGRVRYGRGADRWMGATYDPTAHYRAAAVFDFFETQGLAPEHLRAVSQHQVGRLASRCEELGPGVRPIGVEGAGGVAGVAGFLALELDDAAAVERRLRDLGVHTDHRGSVLRLGPAPYLTDAQLDAAMERLAQALG